jgi:hypothetical protein
MKRQITPRFVLILIRGAVLSGYVGVAKLVGLDPKQLLVHNREGADRFVSEAAITPLSHRQSLM